jgi:hypothetical protein
VSHSVREPSGCSSTAFRRTAVPPIERLTDSLVTGSNRQRRSRAAIPAAAGCATTRSAMGARRSLPKAWLLTRTRDEEARGHRTANRPARRGGDDRRGWGAASHAAPSSHLARERLVQLGDHGEEAHDRRDLAAGLPVESRRGSCRDDGPIDCQSPRYGGRACRGHACRTPSDTALRDGRPIPYGKEMRFDTFVVGPVPAA